MESKQLPPKVAQRLGQLYHVMQATTATYQNAASTALEMLGLDPNIPCNIDFGTGAVSVQDVPLTRTAEPAPAEAPHLSVVETEAGS